MQELFLVSNQPLAANPGFRSRGDGRSVWEGMTAFLLVLLAGYAGAQLPDVHEIMQRVAWNQAKTEDAREQFLYHQKQTVRLHRANGKLVREEYREYDVTPTPRGIQCELIAVQGRYAANDDYVSYDEPQADGDGIIDGVDSGLVEGFSEALMREPDSRDGIANNLFPLTYHQQLKYRFTLMGEETHRGRRVFRVAFEPKSHSDWKGETLIDATEYQPVFVTTKMAQGIPLVVKTLLGSNVKGLGFSVSYEKFANGVWFPVSYGGEFELRVLFFYKRTISISLVNSNFQHVDVSSHVRYSAETQ